MSSARAPLALVPRTYSILDAAGICFRCAPVAAFLYGFLHLVSAAITPLATLVAARFIDAAIGSVRAGSASPEVFASLALLIGLAAYQWLERALHNFADLALVLALRERYRTALTLKRARLEHRHVDDAATWDLVQRVALNPEGGRLKAAYFHLVDLVSFVVKVGGLLAILTSVVWWGGAAMIAISAFTLVTGIRGGKLQYRAEREVSRLDARVDYFAGVLLGREAAQERSLFAFTPFMAAKWKDALLGAMAVRIRARARWYVSAYLGNLVTQASWIFSMIVLLPPLAAGAVTVGLYIALTQAFTGLDIVWGFMETVQGLSQDTEFFRDLSSFLALSEAPTRARRLEVVPPDVRIDLRGVSFTYPGGHAPVLRGFSCTFLPGRHYAVVGPNGAGKTTLTRLLTGLYAPDSGEILFNGVPIRELDSGDLARLFAVVYQDFARYQLTLRDTILLGAEVPAARFDRVLEETGVSSAIARLPLGLDTMIGKLADGGMDLSAGEWQRVAMARCLVRQAPVRLLDEPTAALDPVAESELYELFNRISRDATTLLISHRLGATKIADEIVVIDGGRVAESGSHEELVARGGLYRDMYDAQRSWYETAH